MESLMENIYNILLEADSDILLPSELKAKLGHRTAKINRTVKQLNAAANKAEAEGNKSKADELRQAATKLGSIATGLNYDDANSDGSSDSDAKNGKGEGDNKDKNKKPGEGDSENKEAGDQGDDGKDGQDGPSKDGKDGQDGKDSKGKSKDKADSGDSDSDGDDGDEDSASQSSSQSSSNQQSQSSQGSSGSQGDQGDEGDSGDEGDQDDNSNGDSESDSDQQGFDPDDPIKDIFDDRQASTRASGGKMPDKEPRDPTVDEIIKQLKNLPERAIDGAIDGLKSLLGQQDTLTDSLHEALKIPDKTLADMSDDEFADMINSAIDLLDDGDTKIISSDEMDKRKAEIKRVATDKNVQRELDVEDNVELRKDYQKVKAREEEANRYINYPSVQVGQTMFLNAIRNQVAEYEDSLRTYSRINNKYDDDPDVIMKGKKTMDAKGKVPSVDIYFDQSGSWNDEDIEQGNQTVAALQKLAKQGVLKLNIYYFAEHVHSNINSIRIGSHRLESGTFAWNEILQNIKANNTKNVVLMTDRDMEGQARSSQKCTVDGVVWFIWKQAHNWNGALTLGSEAIPQKLIGRRGNIQSSFIS